MDNQEAMALFQTHRELIEATSVSVLIDHTQVTKFIFNSLKDRWSNALKRGDVQTVEAFEIVLRTYITSKELETLKLLEGATCVA